MDTYVCLILSRQRQIITVEALTAETEAGARDRAMRLVAHHPNAVSFELWLKGKKFVYTVEVTDGAG